MSLVDVAFSPIHNESVRFCNACNDNSLILIYLSVGGSLIPMRVLESDSIASVKLRIQKCKGFVVKKQKLVFSGRELARENSLVKDYGLTSGNVLHLVLKLSDLLLVTVETSCGQEFEFHVDRCKNVGYLKKRIVKEGKCCFVDVDEEEIVYNGERLDNTRTVADICNDKDASIHLLVQKSAKVRAKPVEKDFEILVVAPNEKRDGVGNGSAKNKQPERSYALEPFVVNPKIKLSSVFWDMVKATYDGLERGYEPIRSTEGTGGAYFMRDQFGKYVSVFKPIDEEPMAVNNPQGLPVSTNGEGLKRGTRVGEGAVREVAAYLLDHPKCGPRELSGEVMGFAGVPPTLIVQCLHQGFNHPEGYEGGLTNVKIGSLQMFVKNEGNCDDIGPGAFPVEEVHKISVLDIRLANADRHAGNILITKGEDGQTLLTPIDHGYCLPEKFEDCTFDWLYWPQARQPYSPEVIDYIKSLDAENDIALLKHYGWDVPIECARTLLISTMLLKKGVERGLTPFDIGSIMCRENLNKESVIEEIVREALDSSITGMSEAVLLETISRIMDSQLDKLIRK